MEVLLIFIPITFFVLKVYFEVLKIVIGLLSKRRKSE